MVGLGADRRRIHEHVRAAQRVDARELWKPLVPARRQAEFRRADINDREDVSVAGTGSEVTVLVVSGRHRDVQLARRSDQAAVGCHDNRRVVAAVVVVAVSLIERGMDMRSRFFRHANGEAVGPTAGQLLWLDACRAGPARIDGEVAAERELLQAHQLGSLASGGLDPRLQRVFVLAGAGMPALLHRADAHRRALRRSRSGRGGRRREGRDQARRLHCMSLVAR